ncbi:MAG: hypothetical protein U0X93_04425 [Anaerolineales bacterium]
MSQRLPRLPRSADTHTKVHTAPIGSVISAGLFGSEFVLLAQASTLCGACKDACPVDIDLPGVAGAGKSRRVSSL